MFSILIFFNYLRTHIKYKSFGEVSKTPEVRYVDKAHVKWAIQMGIE